MNFVSKLHARRALFTVAIGCVALAAGCSSFDGDGAGDIQLSPTLEIAVAALDLPNDYYGPEPVYVPVAPLDLPNDYYQRVAESSEVDEIVVASANEWMHP
jgi:hypothetical protein